MINIALFKRLGAPYDPIKTSERKWLSHLKRDIVSPEESVYYYIKYMYPDINITLVNRNKLGSKIKLLNSFDMVFLGLEELTLPFLEFSKRGDIKGYTDYFDNMKKIKTLYPRFEYVSFIADKCKYYSFLEKNNIPVAPTKCFNGGSIKYEYVRRLFKRNGWDKKIFLKPTPSAAGTNSNSFSIENKNKLREYTKRVRDKKYNKIVAQPFLPNFATKGNKELRTFWVNKSYQYTISTTSKGYDWTRISKPMDRFIMDTSVRILELLEKKFKHVNIITRIDWGYDKHIGPFVNEIEYAPGFFTEMFNQGGKGWKTDVKIAQEIVKIASS
jgi:hypothetical protein